VKIETGETTMRCGVIVGLSLGFALTIFSVPLGSDAQQSAKVPRLGYLSPGDVPPYDNAFLRVLEDQGYILPGEIPRYDAASWRDLVKQGYFEGQRIRIDIRATGGHFERASEPAAELVGLNVDVIFAATSPLVKAAQDAVRKANKATPVVFTTDFDAIAEGLVASWARPGGNTTGVALLDAEFDAKQLGMLKETFPGLTRVVYLTNPAWSPSYFRRSKPAMEAAARAMSIRLRSLEVDTLDDLERAFSEITDKRIQAIMVPRSPLFYANRHRIIDFAAKRRLPAMYSDALFVEEGGLMFYGASLADQMRRSAALVAKILKGAKPADIPVEQPTTYKLVINLKTARALGLTIPTEILSRADQVIR
jgi:putative ABC transport system substrate-binding protein